MKNQKSAEAFFCTFLCLKKSTQKYAELLEKAFVSNDDVTVDIYDVKYYPSDNVKFRGGIGVVSLLKSKRSGLYYTDKIHTNKDVVYREENIQFLANGAIELAQML